MIAKLFQIWFPATSSLAFQNGASEFARIGETDAMAFIEPSLDIATAEMLVTKSFDTAWIVCDADGCASDDVSIIKSNPECLLASGQIVQYVLQTKTPSVVIEGFFNHGANNVPERRNSLRWNETDLYQAGRTCCGLTWLGIPVFAPRCVLIRFCMSSN